MRRIPTKPNKAAVVYTIEHNQAVSEAVGPLLAVKSGWQIDKKAYVWLLFWMMTMTMTMIMMTMMMILSHSPMSLKASPWPQNGRKKRLDGRKPVENTGRNVDVNIDYTGCVVCRQPLGWLHTSDMSDTSAINRSYPLYYLHISRQTHYRSIPIQLMLSGGRLAKSA